MKKLIAFFGIILFVIGGCKKIKSTGHAKIVIHKQYFVPGTDKPFNGERTEHYVTGELQTKATYVDGYPETVISFYRNQQKRVKLVFADSGKGDMIAHTEWYESGQKKFESKNSLTREWYENGQLKTKVHYDEENNLHGVTKIWYEDGTLKGTENYEHSKLDGERIKWDNKGNKTLTQVYDKGELIEEDES